MNNIFKKLNSISKSATPDFWDSIESNLEEQENKGIKIKRKNFNKYGLIAACLVVTVVSIYAFQNILQNKKNIENIDMNYVTDGRSSISNENKDIYQPMMILKDATIAEINKALNINITEFKNIPTDLTKKFYQLSYYNYSDKAVYAQISFKNDKENRFFEISINKMDKQEYPEKGVTDPPTPADIAPDVKYNSRLDSSVSSNVASDFPATEKPSQSSPGNPGEDEFKFDTKKVTINNTEVDFKMMTNIKTNDTNYYTSINKDDMIYNINAGNLTLKEITEIIKSI